MTVLNQRLPDDMTDLAVRMAALGQAAKDAAAKLALADRATKDRALRAMATALRADRAKIIAANAADMADGKQGGLSVALLDRLMLDEKRVEAMALGLEEIAELPDPVGRELAAWDRPNGLNICRISVPLGVIGIIYESRPNVTADAGGLCLKSGNAAILRGGSESARSTRAILACLQTGLRAAGLPEAAIQCLPTTDRKAVGIMLTMIDAIDLIIPRGGRGLIERVAAESRIPVLKHLDGNCHTYVDAAADADKARRITINAKMRRIGVCGATETLLVDQSRRADLLPQLVADLLATGCAIRGDAATQALDNRVTPASALDWDTEFLDAIIAVKLVSGVDEAIAHINRHGSHHTEAIITEDVVAAEKFLREVDAGIVIHNSSTQFADGGEFGMGAEIGISTGKLHARGPVGAEQLTSYKYVVRGNGQIRP